MSTLTPKQVSMILSWVHRNRAGLRPGDAADLEAAARAKNASTADNVLVTMLVDSVDAAGSRSIRWLRSRIS